MSVFVLVHGAWGGGWQWRTVAKTLRAEGHEVYTPTLTGLGDRSHLTAGGTAVGFVVHIHDVVQVLYFEDLTDVILVGWSYGGLVVDGVADLVPERLRAIVNIDGGVAEDGAPVMAQWTTKDRALGAIPPPTAEDLRDAIDDAAQRDRVGDRLRPHPVTEDDRFPDNAGRRFAVPHTYFRCTVDPMPEETEVMALRSDSRWVFRELLGDHLAPLDAPEIVSDALLRLATSVPTPD